MSSTVDLNSAHRRRFVVRVALTNLKLMKQAQAEYEEAVREWYSRGDGRPYKLHTFVEGDEVYQTNVGGHGWRFPECIHGRSLWVDHDIPCGECEAGYTLYEMALSRAHAHVTEYERRLDVTLTASRAKVPDSVHRALVDWTLDALPAYYRDAINAAPTRRNLP